MARLQHPNRRTRGPNLERPRGLRGAPQALASSIRTPGYRSQTGPAHRRVNLTHKGNRLGRSALSTPAAFAPTMTMKRTLWLATTAPEARIDFRVSYETGGPYCRSASRPLTSQL